MSDKKKRYILPEEEIPHYWYNIQADMVNKPMPPLHPGTKQPLKAEDLYPIFAEELCRQELNQTDQWIEIPEEVREAALLDGAKGWTLDRCIVLPLIKDTIKTISILSVSAGFLLYNEVYFLTNGAAGTKSISFLIRELAVVSPRAQYARANAIGAIQILGGLVLILIINMLFRERKQKGGRR